MSKITISDIAKLAGVGKATVSRVLNGSGYVSADTRDKVEQIIRENTYTPSAMARNLSKRVSETIGVIIPDPDNPFFAEILKGVSGVVDAHNLTLIFCNTDNMLDKDIKALHVMCRNQVRGLIYTPAVSYETPGEEATVRELLGKLKAPVVALDRPVGSLDLDGVFSDNFAGAYAATTALINAGHRSIGTISGDQHLFIGRERLRGFTQALDDHGLPLDDRHIIRGNFDTEESYRLSQQLLAGRSLPSAFFAANNLGAMGFLKALNEIGMRIPEDMGFISFDRLGNLNDMGFRLSYVDRNVMRMGIEAMRLLMAKMDNANRQPEKIVFPARLTLLGSERLARPVAAV